MFKSATVRSGDVAATQTNFPSYVDLDRLGITTLAEAESVRVYADSGKTTEWAREIVSVTEMHVKVPSLTSTVEIFVDWDGVRADYAVTDTFGRNAVWSDYRLVHHLDDTTNATGNTSFNLTNVNSVTFTSGKLGNAAAFGASNSNKHLHTGTNEPLDKTEVQQNWTISTWVKLTTLSTVTIIRQFGIDGSSKKSCQMAFDTSAGIRYQWTGSAVNQYSSGDNLTGNQWGKVDFVLGTSGALNLYLDGVNILTTTVTNFNSRGDTSGSDKRWMYGGDFAIGTLFNPLRGFMDESRLVLSPLTANWITTEYNNQNDEATFWGTWTDAGGAPAAQTARRGVVMMM